MFPQHAKPFLACGLPFALLLLAQVPAGPQLQCHRLRRPPGHHGLTHIFSLSRHVLVALVVVAYSLVTAVVSPSSEQHCPHAPGRMDVLPSAQGWMALPGAQDMLLNLCASVSLTARWGGHVSAVLSGLDELHAQCSAQPPGAEYGSDVGALGPVVPVGVWHLC